MPSLLLCGFQSFPAAPVNPAAAVVEALGGQGFRASGMETRFLTLPVDWSRSAEDVAAELTHRPATGVLVVGVAVKATAFRVETLARNIACPATPDAAGARWPGGAILAGGAPTLPASAPTTEMVEAIAALGLPAESSCDAGDYLCNFTFYRLLADALAPRAGFLHVPQAREHGGTAGFDLLQIEAAIRAAATAFAAVMAESLAGDVR